MTKINTSRVGRKPVAVPAGVEVKIQGENILVKGSKGHLTLPLHPFVKVTLADGFVRVEPDQAKRKNITGINIKLYKSIAGTIRSNISNGIHGVTKGFERRLTLVGVGYRAQAKGKVVALSLGYSHPT